MASSCIHPPTLLHPRIPNAVRSHVDCAMR
jgi:hypothetical protein